MLSSGVCLALSLWGTLLHPHEVMLRRSSALKHDIIQKGVCVEVEGGLWGAFKTAKSNIVTARLLLQRAWTFFSFSFLNYTGEEDVVFITLRLRASGVTCEGKRRVTSRVGKHHGGFYSPCPSVRHSNAPPLRWTVPTKCNNINKQATIYCLCRLRLGCSALLSMSFIWLSAAGHV